MPVRARPRAPQQPPQQLNLLNTRSTADASLILARQLIAAKLNVFDGSNVAPASAAIATVHSLLGGFAGKLPYAGAGVAKPH